MRMPFVPLASLTSLIAFLLLSAHGRPQAPQKTDPKGRISVGANVQVSKDREKLAHAEVVIAADDAHEGRLLAGSMVQDGYFQTSAYMSLDGGKTWKLALEKKSKHGCADPAVAFGPDSAAYFAFLAFDDGPDKQHWEITASRDEGRSWSAPFVARLRAGTPMDRPFLAVDRTRGRFHDHIYCTMLYGDLAVFRSRDGAKAFDAPKLLACKGRTPSRNGIPSQGVVLSDGTLVFPYTIATRPSIGQLSLRVRRSTTGGDSFHEEQFLHEYRNTEEVPETPSCRGWPMMAADPGSKKFNDRLYLVWSEASGVSTRAMLSISKDKGVAWSKPMVISNFRDSKNDVKSSTHYALLPTVAVNRSGIVGVSWYEVSFSGQEKYRCELRFQASVDGGATWLPSVAVTDVASTYGKGSRESRVSWLGDTAGLAVDSTGAFHPLWIDNRTGIKQVFTARVFVER
jgi:hypothetical protein